MYPQSRYRRRLSRIAKVPVYVLTDIGTQAEFYVDVTTGLPRAARRYWKETTRLLASVSLGTGGLAIIGGTVMVVVFMTAAIGVEVGLQGYSSLANIGIGALAGFVASYANTREVAPIVAGIALTATVGAGFTAQLGSMRISEEIDALEVMAIPSVPFLVTTRILAGSLAVVPIYCLALLGSFLATRLIVTLSYGQSGGTYDHYFSVFLVPSDMAWSLLKVVAMAIVIMANHCYYGYHAIGGPAGVGEAVGRAVRSSLIALMLIDLVLDLAIYGGASTVHVTG